jgi:hypothetical protein
MTIRCLICDHNDAGHRYACDHCIQKTQRQVREIGTYWNLLTTTAMHEPTRGATGRGTPGYTSRPPARLDVIATLDIRSTGDIHGPDDTDQPIVSITAAIHHITTWINTTTGQPGSGYGYLLGSVHHVAMTRHIARLASEVSRLHRQLRALAHDAPPRPLGVCLGVDAAGECGGAVYQTWRDQVEGARCSRCLRVYTGLDLVRLSVAQEAS